MARIHSLTSTCTLGPHDPINETSVVKFLHLRFRAVIFIFCF